MNCLNMNQVSYTYRGKYKTVYALNEVTASFEEGNFYAVTGKSGSGKTTLLSLLCGLDLPSKGEIAYNQTSLAMLDLDAYRKNTVAMIYQGYNLLPKLTILENVMYPLSLKKTDKKNAEQIAAKKLEKVALKPEYYDKFPAMLSGGEQQRAAIARALAASPKFILADEPTGNLDTENSNNIIQILRNCTDEEGICVILVTHDLQAAAQTDIQYQMEDGKLIL